MSVIIWRRRRDLNPRYPFGVYTISNRARSASYATSPCVGFVASPLIIQHRSEFVNPHFYFFGQRNEKSRGCSRASIIWSIPQFRIPCYNPEAYANSKREVNNIGTIRKITIPLFLLLVLFLIPIQSKAISLESKGGIVSVSGGWLNVRAEPSAYSSKVSSLQKGSYITLISKSGSWWKVEYAAGKYGYCHADYIRIASSDTATVAVSSGSLNIRSGAGTGYSKIGSLYRGNIVVVLAESNGWTKILFNGTRIGYVSSKYLSSYYPAVSNYVPSFKQMDSRWADIVIGSSGKTFSQIGCATTAIAMMESRRRGYTVYPDKMAGELRYTPSGSVYWPQDYSVVTQSAGYLERIYNLLGQGKVVLFGSRNQYDTQHWVVITGFSGGPSLTTSGFTIQDPGTYTRTTLKQFLDVYPNFYKYFYY